MKKRTRQTNGDKDMNNELWEKAIEYHGHKCMGLALGFRMGEEAKSIFGANADIHCKMPAKTCITDGVTGATGASEANGRIQIDASLSHYLFYLPGEEEGWAITRKEINFPKNEDGISIVLSCSRDFLFTLEPVDIE